MTGVPNARALQLPPVDGTSRTKLTPILQAQVIGALKVTGSIKTACVALGIPWSRAAKWFARGRKGIEPYASFANACKQAKAQRELVLEGIVINAAFGAPASGGSPARPPNWKAANALRSDKRSARQRAAAAEGNRDDEDSPILIYPVPVREGDDLAAVALAHGAAIDTHGETVPEGESDGDDDDGQRLGGAGDDEDDE